SVLCAQLLKAGRTRAHLDAAALLAAQNVNVDVDARGRVDVAALESVAWNEAKKIAALYDKRNGNRWFTESLETKRALLQLAVAAIVDDVAADGLVHLVRDIEGGRRFRDPGGLDGEIALGHLPLRRDEVLAMNEVARVIVLDDVHGARNQRALHRLHVIDERVDGLQIRDRRQRIERELDRNLDVEPGHVGDHGRDRQALRARLRRAQLHHRGREIERHG